MTRAKFTPEEAVPSGRSVGARVIEFMIPPLRYGIVISIGFLTAAGCEVPRTGAPPTVTPDRACPSQAVIPEAQAAAAIAKLLDDWHQAAAASDEARYFALMSADSVFLGTDATERWSKDAFQAYARPHFAAGKGWAMQATKRNIVVEPAGHLAHFDEELETKGLGPARGSGVLVLRDGVWKILHYNLSITVPNDRFGVVKEALAWDKLLEVADGSTHPARALAGSWVGAAKDGSAIEEHWTHDRAGTMVGMGRSQNGSFFEFLRIETRKDGGVVYVAQPLGKKAVEFTLTSKDPAKLVFENSKHDYPKRITYAWASGKLDVSIEGDAKQPKESWTMTRTLVAPTKGPAATTQ